MQKPLSIKSPQKKKTYRVSPAHWFAKPAHKKAKGRIVLFQLVFAKLIYKVPRTCGDWYGTHVNIRR